MRVFLFGEKREEILPLIKKYNFDVLDGSVRKEKAEVVICYGGDGTLMLAEYHYPGIPKLLLRGSRICKKCESLPNEEILKRVRERKYKIINVWKLEGKLSQGKIIGLNDIIIHNSDVRHAVRYRVFIDNNDLGDEIIGDGVIISTPFGSTGYYRSITKSVFETGMGLAFNNSTEPLDHMVLDERRSIRVVISRGPAVVYADNVPKNFVLESGEEIEVKKSKKVAKIVRVL